MSTSYLLRLPTHCALCLSWLVFGLNSRCGGFGVLGAGAKELLVLLLGLDEGLLEEVGVYSTPCQLNVRDLCKTGSLLSVLAKRIAKVHGSGSPSETSAAAFQTQLRSLPTFGESFMSGTTTDENQPLSQTTNARSCSPYDLVDGGNIP
jgi:hypothetical protein